MNLVETNIIGRQTRERIVSPRACPLLTGLGIELTGTSEAKAGFRFHRPQPNRGQVLACEAGYGRVMIDGQWTRCGPNQAYVTPALVPHAYEAVRGVTWRVAWVMYHAATPLGSRPRLERADSTALADAIAALHRELLGPADPAVLHHAVCLVHLHAQRIAGPSRSEFRLTRVWDAVHRQPDYPWDMAELAALADMSEEHLRRLSHRETGQSPMRHVTLLRMQRAEALLTTGSLSVTEVARAVGYLDPFAFSTAFRRWCGHPPSRVKRTQL